MIMIRNWLRYLLRREKWVRHPEDGTWHKGGALIEQQEDGTFLLWGPQKGFFRHATRHASLREAIEAEADGT